MFSLNYIVSVKVSIWAGTESFRFILADVLAHCDKTEVWSLCSLVGLSAELIHGRLTMRSHKNDAHTRSLVILLSRPAWPLYLLPPLPRPIPHRLCSPPLLRHSQLKPALPTCVPVCFSQPLDDISAQSNSPDAIRGFANSREPAKPVWSPLNAFSALWVCLLRTTNQRVRKHTKHLRSYHSWDRPNCFLSVDPLPLHSPGCQCIRPRRDYSMVHGGRLLSMLKSHLVLVLFPFFVPALQPERS